VSLNNDDTAASVAVFPRDGSVADERIRLPSAQNTRFCFGDASIAPIAGAARVHCHTCDRPRGSRGPAE
jgi:hypothetical protein